MMLRLLLSFPFLLLFITTSPAQNRAATSSPANTSSEPVSRTELLQEIDTKMERVQQFLREHNLGGVLLSRINNFSWITAGIGDSHIVITSETGPASLLIMRDGKKYLVANNTEVPHLMAEDLQGLGYEPKEFMWYEESKKEAIIKTLAAEQPIGSDVAWGDLRFVDGAFAALRFQLTDSEVKKYRWVGQKSTEAVNTVCRMIKPGMTEKEIETVTSHELLKRGLRPTVVLIGADERVINYFHYPPTDKRLKKYAIVNVCARRWGLVSSVARYVHFGPVPDELKKAIKASAVICANMQAASRPGVKASDIFARAKQWYAENGYPDGWKPIHIGGAIGYAEREWVASDESKEVLHDHQAFAWNPFTKGALSFDTFILYNDRIENITTSKDWPAISVTINGETYQMPDILMRKN